VKKVAIFIDWENFRLDIAKIQRTSPGWSFNYNDPSSVYSLILRFLEDKEEIYRIFFYTAYPLDIEQIKAQLSQRDRNSFEEFLNGADNRGRTNREKWQNISAVSRSFIDSFAQMEYVANRIGILKVRGVDANGSPILVQKRVDMLLGLDIAHISYEKLSDKILVFSKDTDIIPALKTSRINGLQTAVAAIKEGSSINSEIKKHCDRVILKSCFDL